VLDARADVVRCLLTYTDWWQPSTTSVLQVGAARRSSSIGEAFREGLLDTLDERTELCRRSEKLSEREREILFLWYIRQLDAGEIARAVGISRRQCFRVRAQAIGKIVELGEPKPAEQ
jgi:DNA-directed RNA polymerase specialized sigma24 family protein